jgi:hypothetical protein
MTLGRRFFFAFFDVNAHKKTSKYAGLIKLELDNQILNLLVILVQWHPSTIVDDTIH